MKNQMLLMLLGLVAGALIPVQAATNATFSRATGSPIVTALVVFVIGLLAVTVYLFASRTSLPGIAQLKAAPPYSYLGGLIVAFYIISITILAPRLGIATAIGLIITGQVLAAVAIDHFGLFDVAVRHIDIKRLAGTLCMIAGIYLVMKK
jgi:transporter family-2 protein